MAANLFVSFDALTMSNVTNLLEQVHKYPLQGASEVTSMEMSNSSTCTSKLNNNSEITCTSLHWILNLIFTGIVSSSYLYTLITLLLSRELLNNRRYFSTFNYCLWLVINFLIDRIPLVWHADSSNGILRYGDLLSLSAAYTWIMMQGYLIYEKLILTRDLPLPWITVIGYLTPIKITIFLHFIIIPETQYTSSDECSLDQLTVVPFIWPFVLFVAAAQTLFTSIIIYTYNANWTDGLTGAFYRNWMIISLYFSLTLLLSAVDRHLYSTSWSTLVAETSRSLVGPLVFVLEVLMNRQLLETLSFSSYNSQSTSLGEWHPHHETSCNRKIVISSESAVDKSDNSSHASADSTAVPLAPLNSPPRYREEQYIYV